MTGPVERVPLTDERRLSDVTLDYWAGAAETAPPGELGTMNFPAVAQMLIAELRASRAREQELLAQLEDTQQARTRTMALLTECASIRYRLTVERDDLQQRIDKALLRLHRINPYPQSNPLPSIAELRTILAGTEPRAAPLD